MYVGTDVNYRGKVLQVATAINGAVSASFDDTITPQEVVSLTITPKSNNSLMQIKCMLASTQAYVMAHYIYKNGSILVSPTADNGSDNGGGLFTNYDSTLGNSNSTISIKPVVYNDTNNQMSDITYSIRQAQDWTATGGDAWRINSRGGNDMGSNSTLVVWEYQL
jgi:hypothetical protein